MTKKLFLFTILLQLSFQLCAQTDITVHDDNTGKDEVIELPEGMIYETDRLLNEWNAKNYLMNDINCESSSENPQYSKEEYISRLSRLPNIIEMPYNDVVRKLIDYYCTKLRKSVSYMLGANNFYVPIFEEALESYQVPLELKYLPIIESALNPGATSRAGAAGLWQFMVKTGKIYGLTVNSLIDERRDPIKSSYAAARYLKDLYNIFNDWTLAIAAYNCGPANVNKAIRRSGGQKDYWQIYPYLPKETRGYVPAFIAANYVMNYYCDHNICPMNMTLPASTDTIMIHRDLHFEQLVAMCNVKEEEVKALNPQYRTGLIPGAKESCILRLPTHSISAFIAAGDSVYKYKSDELFTNRKETKVNETNSGSSGSKYVTIRKGDSLSTIAARNRTTVAKLRKLNGIKGNNIRAGKRIRVR
ncbi:MAG: transglycosylase SLT domain-containing protein [Paraprevotella sp.]|jgi:membrane-bound lytic murein transglycosylase D|nr:transglycosylase SLT domain-containing protein [Paraprevotella sp.]